MKTNQLFNLILLVTFSAMLFSGCKKNTTIPAENNNSTTAFHSRTANIIGQPISIDSGCLKKAYHTNADTAAIRYYYNNNGLLVRVVQDPGFIGSTDSIICNYSYDSLSRLINVGDIHLNYSLDYGSSTNYKVQTIIAGGDYYSQLDTIYCSYPDASTVVARQTNHTTSIESIDTLFFDTDNSLLRAVFVAGPIAGPYQLQNFVSSTFDQGKRAVYYPSPYLDYIMLNKLHWGTNYEQFSYGPKLESGSEGINYAYNPYEAVSINSMESNQDNFGRTTYLKYKEDDWAGPTHLYASSFSITWYFEYDCN